MSYDPKDPSELSLALMLNYTVLTYNEQCRQLVNISEFYDDETEFDLVGRRSRSRGRVRDRVKDTDDVNINDPVPLAIPPVVT